MDKLLLDLKARALARDKKMDDPKGDGSGDDARCPTGDDYSKLYDDLTGSLLAIAQRDNESYTETWLELESSPKGAADWNKVGAESYGTIFQAIQAMNKCYNRFDFDWRIVEVTNTSRPIDPKEYK